MKTSRRRFLLGAGGVVAVAAAGTGGYYLTRPSHIQTPGMSRALAIATDETAPAETDVVIIGAGIAGISTALSLSEKGYRVTLFEKGVVAGEQSSRAFGWISSLGDSPLRLALAAPSRQIWAGLAERLDIDPTYRANGLLFECADEEEVAQWQTWARDNYELGGADIQILRGDALADRLPQENANQWHAGVLQPLDGSVEPPLAVPRIAEAIRKQGVTIVENCAVRGIETSAGGISSVVTEKGETSCQAVVLAGGAWSRLFLQNYDVTLPLLRVYSYMLRVPAFEGGPQGSGLGSGTAWRQELDGGYSLGIPTNIAPILPDNFRFLSKFYSTLFSNLKSVDLTLTHEFLNQLFLEKSWSNDQVTPFEERRILVPEPDSDLTASALNAFRAAFPGAEHLEPAESWGGVIDNTPDTAPIIQKIDSIPGLVVVTGLSGHGLSMGPAAGQLAAEMVVNETQMIADPQLYSATRF